MSQGGPLEHTQSIPQSLAAGLFAGVVGLLVFLTIHHFWIRPIWFILPAGLPIAALGGAATGWAYDLIRAGLPPRPWTSLAMILLIAVILAPGILFAQTRPSVVDMTTFTIPSGSGSRAVSQFIFELILPAIAIGALAGWLLGRSWQAALATAVAGFVFALGPGHNIPFLGSTPGVTKGLVLLLAITVSSSITLVETSALLASR